MNEIVIPHNFDPEKRPYQLKILKSRARFKFLIIHRKAGKTALAVNRLIIQSLKQVGIRWYVAPTYKQGKEIVWRDPDMLFKYIPKEILAKKPNESELTVPFIGGSILGIKGADEPDALRGPNPKDVVLDEAFMMKQEIWTEILLPIAMANPDMNIWIIGTPKPEGAFWWELYQKFQARMEAGDQNYFAMTLRAEDSGILSGEQLAEAKDTMTQMGYEQEFGCVYHGTEGVVFRGIDRCILKTSGNQPIEYDEKEYNRNFRYKFGIDLARLQDWTVMTGINRMNFHVDYFDRFNQVDYRLQKARIEAVLRRYGNAEADIDSTGVGDPIVDDLGGRGLNVRGIGFTEQMKANLIQNLALHIEQGKIKFPNIPDLITELRQFGYEVTKGGHVRYSAPDGKHDDCVISLALAVWELGSRLKPTGAAVLDGPVSSGRRTSFQ